jgi:hypothetical protein
MSELDPLGETWRARCLRAEADLAQARAIMPVLRSLIEHLEEMDELIHRLHHRFEALAAESRRIYEDAGGVLP